MKSYGTPRRGNARVAARTAILKEAEREATLAERARIVAWLRSESERCIEKDEDAAAVLDIAADAIERGEREEPKP
jgi:hypothetical protein